VRERGGVRFGLELLRLHLHAMPPGVIERVVRDLEHRKRPLVPGLRAGELDRTLLEFPRRALGRPREPDDVVLMDDRSGLRVVDREAAAR
jgi:hypothetical protein